MMFPLLFALLLCLQWVAGDDAAEFDRLHKTPASPHVLAQLLVPPNPKFAVRAPGDGCPTGYNVCTNYPDKCAKIGSFCCSETVNCPIGGECCPGGLDCCDTGDFCCTDSFGGCCPVGSYCTVGSNTCSGSGYGGSSGGGGGGSSSSSAKASSSSTKASSSSTKAATVVSSPTSSTKAAATVVGGGTVNPSFVTPAVASPTSATPGLGGVSTSGSPHSISVIYVGMTASFATVIGIIALGRSLF
ncbi:hypothetical protein HD554DRAFT_205310 [Boletus coccyginus]|nr:hypothetical protein HD554DRAFT_205310 [Boletus coccyginus]